MIKQTFGSIEISYENHTFDINGMRISEDMLKKITEGKIPGKPVIIEHDKEQRTLKIKTYNFTKEFMDRLEDQTYHEGPISIGFKKHDKSESTHGKTKKSKEIDFKDINNLDGKYESPPLCPKLIKKMVVESMEIMPGNILRIHYLNATCGE